MKMLGTAHQAFVEADLAYRRERISAAFGPGRSNLRHGWVQRVRHALRNNTDLRGGYPQPDTSRSLVDPSGWSGNAYPRVTPAPHH
jgi:hypothetical protein